MRRRVLALGALLALAGCGGGDRASAPPVDDRIPVRVHAAEPANRVENRITIAPIR